jgi:hypothetical protein
MVARPSRYGNQFRIYDPHPETGQPMTRHEVVTLHDEWLRGEIADLNMVVIEALADLRGHDVACWCGLDQKCHGDNWLREANR